MEELQLTEAVEKLEADFSSLGKHGAKYSFEAVKVVIEMIAALDNPDHRQAFVYRLTKCCELTKAELQHKVARIRTEQQAEKVRQATGTPWTDNGLVLHGNYLITSEGVLLLGKDSNKLLLHKPTWVKGFALNVTNGHREMLEVAWFESDANGSIAERSRIIPKCDLYDSRKLALWGEQGLKMVPSEVTKVANYFAASEAANESYLKAVTRYLSTRPGWVQISPDAPPVFAAYADNVIFDPESGYAKIAKYLDASGTLEEWIEGIKPAMEKSPLMAFFLAAALASMLLDSLNQPGFVVDQNAPSSSGKTTTLTVVASAFGKPGGNQGRGLVAPWTVTPNAIEMHLAFYTGFPVFCMDSHLVKREDLEKIAYAVGNGVGKMRLNKDISIRERSEFKAVLMSDGEAALYDSLDRNGAKARSISIRCSGAKDLDRSDVVALKEHIDHQYGTLAPEMVRQILDHRDEIGTWFREYRQEYCSESVGMEDRIENYFAIIRTAAKVVALVDGMQWFEVVADSAIQIARSMALQDLQSEERSDKALQFVATWYVRHRSRITNSASDLVEGVCYGRELLNRQTSQVEYVALMPDLLEKALKDNGFQTPESLIREWASAGILEVDDGSPTKRRVKIQNTTAWIYCFKADRLIPEAAKEPGENSVSQSQSGKVVFLHKVDKEEDVSRQLIGKLISSKRLRTVNGAEVIELELQEKSGTHFTVQLHTSADEVMSVWKTFRFDNDVLLTVDVLKEGNALNVIKMERHASRKAVNYDRQ